MTRKPGSTFPFRGRFREKLVDLPLRLLIRALRLLPYRLRIAAGGWFVRRVVVNLTDSKQRILANLALVKPAASAREKQRIVSGCLDNCGRLFAEYYSAGEFVARARLSKMAGPGMDALREAHVQGRGVLFATGHFGNFEAGRAALIGLVRRWTNEGIASESAQRAALIQKGWIVGGLYRPTNNLYYQQHHKAAFAGIGEPAIPKGVSGLRELFRYLGKGGWLMILHDQHDDHGVRQQFLGRDVLTSVSAARLALRHDALLVPYYGIREANGLDFTIIIETPVAPTDELKMTAQLTASLEKMVNAHPEQWFWIHRRWRESSAPAAPQGRSIATAVASPPPMQMTAIPRLSPAVRRLWISVTRMRAPEAPIGWPRAQAPPRMFSRSGPTGMFAHECHGDNREGFIHLPQIDFGRFPFKDLQELPRRHDRRNREKPRLRGHCALPGNSCENWRIAAFRLLLAGEDQGGGAV